MRKIYNIRPSRTRSVVAKLAIVVAVLAVTGLATRTHPLSDAVSRSDAVIRSDAISPSEAKPMLVTGADGRPYYFPSQYELNAGPPEPHVEAF